MKNIFDFQEIVYIHWETRLLYTSLHWRKLMDLHMFILIKNLEGSVIFPIFTQNRVLWQILYMCLLNNAQFHPYL